MVKHWLGFVSEQCSTISSIFRESAALCEAERSQDSSADLDHGSKDLGPKVTLAGALALLAALAVFVTGAFWDVFFLAHSFLFLHME